MNEFLKKEWEDTALPESDRLRVRNRAWSRYHTLRAKQPNWRWIAASVPLAAVLLWVLNPTSTPEIRFEARPAPLPRLSVAARQPPARLPAETKMTDSRPAPSKSGRRPAAPRQATASSDSAKGSKADEGPAPTRLVLNFRLPDSGVRMIWVQDPNFYRIEGEEK